MIKNITFIRWCLIVTLCLYPAISWSALAVRSEIVSGIIVQKFDNNSIKLDNGKIYQPSRKGLIVTLQPGESITLRYVTDENGNFEFFEYAPGLNSLKAQSETGS